MKRYFRPWVIEVAIVIKDVAIGAVGGIAAVIVMAGWI